MISQDQDQKHFDDRRLLLDRRQKAAEARFLERQAALSPEQLQRLEEAFPKSQTSTPGRGDPFSFAKGYSELERNLMRRAVLTTTEETVQLIRAWRVILVDIAMMDDSYDYGLPPDGDFPGEPANIGRNPHLADLDARLALVQYFLSNGSP